MKRITLSMALMSLVMGLSAVPAKPGLWKTIKLADGTEVKVELRGDEFANYWRAEDGKCYVYDAETNAYNSVQLESIMQRAKANRTKHKALSAQNAPKKRGIGDAGNTTGDLKGIILLAQFPNSKFKPEHTRELYDRIANEKDFKHEYGFKGSIHDYFLAQSNGQLNLKFDVAGPYTMPENYEYYGQQMGEGWNDRNPGAMIKTACKMADADVDFKKYDWDNNGNVDQVVVIFAGMGQAAGGDPNTIWPHESYLSAFELSCDGVSITKYACSAELGAAATIDGIGTFCHEFSHCLGLPDFYDTDYSGGYGGSQWSLMDSGPYNGNSFTPAGYTGYEKWFCGWKEPIELTEDMVVNDMKPISENGDFYIMRNKSTVREYYLLENRQQTGWDEALPGSGMIIWHVDYLGSAWANNTVNDDKNHQRCSVVAADNSYSSYSRPDIAGDAWPYNGKNAFGNETTPAATLFNANDDGKKFLNMMLTGIKKNDDGTMSFKFYNSPKPTPPAKPEGALFYESFFNCAGIGGNDGVWSGAGVGTGTFIADNDWTGNSNGGSECGSFGSATQKGIATTPAITINDKATLTFKAAPFGSAKNTITVSDLSGTVSFSESVFQLEPGKWTECKTFITGTGTVQLRFQMAKKFFIDEVLVMPGHTSTAIDQITTEEETDNRIFSLDGRFLGTDFDALDHGIYIINGKKIVK